MEKIPEFTWSFIEKYYPNYDSCDEIALSSDLYQIVDNEWEEGSDSHKLLLEIGKEIGIDNLRDIQLEASKRSRTLDFKIYNKALEAFIN